MILPSSPPLYKASCLTRPRLTPTPDLVKLRIDSESPDFDSQYLDFDSEDTHSEVGRSEIDCSLILRTSILILRILILILKIRIRGRPRRL